MSVPTPGGDAPTPRLVKCKDCGLLTAKNEHTHEFVELDAPYRSDGSRYGPLKAATSGPLCLPMAFDLSAEFHADKNGGDQRRALVVINRERECGRFTTWRQGLSPKEHLEMLYQDEIRRQAAEQRERDREWQARQEATAREWQESQDRARREWEASQDAAKRERENAKVESDRLWQESLHQTNRLWQRKVALTAGALGLFGTILGASLTKIFTPAPQSPAPPVIIQVPTEQKPSAK